MTDLLQDTSTNRVLVVDDDQMLIDEYVRCLGEDFDDDDAATTFSDLEKSCSVRIRTNAARHASTSNHRTRARSCRRSRQSGD